jgi:hypothetical protein
MLESGVYELLPKDPTVKGERKVQKLLSKYETALLTDLKHKLTPYHSKPPHPNGLPKIQEPDISLRLKLSPIGAPCYALVGFHHKIPSSLAEKSGSFVKKLGPILTVVEVCKRSVS